MRTTFAVSVATVGAFLFSASALGQTRTYDILDLVWYSTGDEGDGGTPRRTPSEEVVDLFKRALEPGTWDGPGAANRIEVRDGRLVVTAPQRVQGDIANILGQLRQSTTVQGVSLDCQFILADEPFLKRHAPAALERGEEGASVRGLGPLKARSLVEAARATEGVVVLPAPPMPLYSMRTSLLLGHDRRLQLPRLDSERSDAGGASVEVVRPMGMSLSVEAVAGARHVTLDLMARGNSLEGMDELEGLYHGTFAVERSGAFLVLSPLVRAKLTGVRGSGTNATEVVREVVAAQSDPPRYLLVVGTVRSMTPAEVTLLAGERVAAVVEERLHGTPDDAAPPAPAPPPGAVAAAPPKPVQLPGMSTRAFDLRALLMGSERGPERAKARAKRVEQVMARVKEALGDVKLPLRQEHGLLIVSAMQHQYDKISAVLDELSAERLVEPE